MNRPRATAPRPAEIQPTVLMRVVSSSGSSGCLGKGRTPDAEASSVVELSARGVERNFMILDDSAGRRQIGKTVARPGCRFCVIGSLTRGMRKGCDLTHAY